MTTTDIEPEITEQQAVSQLAAEGAALDGQAQAGRPGRFTKPGPVTTREQDMRELFEQREDDPPPDVPRDQWDRPLIVTPDGSIRAYVRASSYGCIEDRYGISMWKRSQVVLGMSRAFHLYQRAQSVQGTLTKRDRATLREIADRAEIIAGSDAGSLTGTALHKLSEYRDAGADLSYLDPTTTACLDAYARLMRPFVVLSTELFVVYDEYGSAGTLDRVVRTRWDITLPGGTFIPRGTIVVIDVKTGKITSVKYWMAEYGCQQFIYDGGTPYFPGITHLRKPDVRSIDNIVTVTDQPGENGRVPWESLGAAEPNHAIALILHVPALDPGKARIFVVKLDEARRDADVCRDAWARRRVPWAERFEAIPDAQLQPPDSYAFDEPEDLDGDLDDAGTLKIDSLGVDTDMSEPEPTPPSIPADRRPTPDLVASLRERMRRATDRDTVQQVWEAWHASPRWSHELQAYSEQRWDELTPPEDVTTCDGCNYDTHACPSCGSPVAHGVTVCPPCDLRIALDTAPDRAAISVLWDAHGPDGDHLWGEEHQAAGVARYIELPAMDGWPDLDDVPVPAEPADEPADPNAPVTIPAVGEWPEIILWCHECLLPPGHPQASDPVSWCDCLPTETCMDETWSCRTRAHDPSEHDDEPEPGPFDGTIDLADLRDALREALDTETVDALYDAYGPEAGGPWDDECTALGQAVYDRVGAQEGAQS